MPYAIVQATLDPPTVDQLRFTRDLMAMAPCASVNRGAVLMQRDPPEHFAYPSRRAFEEEMVWIMLRAMRSGGETG